MAVQQKIRIKLSSYDFKLIGKSAEKIVETAKGVGAIISGPIPLPTRMKLYTALKSRSVNKKSREQFQIFIYKRLIDIYARSLPHKVVDALAKIDLPSGVDISIK